MKKPSIPIKKKSGPNTAKGKLVSAQNAIKTGLTAKQLLNDHEYLRLSQLQADLTNHYNGTNPLIALQIEKIARLQIQLERIQNAIDALYRQSELNPPRKEKKDCSPIDSTTLSLHLRIRLGLFDPSIIKKIKVALLGMKIKNFLAKPLIRGMVMRMIGNAQSLPKRVYWGPISMLKRVSTTKIYQITLKIKRLRLRTLEAPKIFIRS